jgi:NAD(P)-dependent dehydrogenase (short-subunit alcohol dehydrogenase family)
LLHYDRPVRLSEKVAIVVGGGQTPGDTIGNGRATAIAFAREGARVLVADRDLASAEETVRMIAADGGTAAAIEMDVTREPDVASMIARCSELYGRIDVLHNNVGIGTRDASAQRIELPDFDRIFDVNLNGPLLACKHAVPVMRQQGSGSIINISSVASVAGVTNMVAYKTSKAALNALTQSLALANARYRVRINAILPGLINTPMAIEGLSAARGVAKEELIAQRDRLVPMGRMGSAWDVAHAAVFLASDESRFVTGVLLPVDGGQTLRVG